MEAERGAVAATGGGAIGAMPLDCTRASSWVLSCAAVSAPLAGAAITATTIAIKNTCFIASTSIYRTIGAREVRKQGIFSPDFPDGPALHWYLARFCSQHRTSHRLRQRQLAVTPSERVAILKIIETKGAGPPVRST